MYIQAELSFMHRIFSLLCFLQFNQIARWIQQNLGKDASKLARGEGDGSLSLEETPSTLSVSTVEEKHSNDFIEVIKVSPISAENPAAVAEREGRAGQFYVYDWPLQIQNITDKKHPERNENFGAGPILDAETGQFNTYMHSLFPIVLHRLLQHPRRTMNPDEAEWFFIPYDLTSDAYYNGNSLIKNVRELLMTSSHFMRFAGADHFFVDSSEPFWYDKKIMTTTFYRFCSRCIKFTPSTLPVPYQRWQKEFTVDHTYVHIPYTSTWHYFDCLPFQPSTKPATSHAIVPNEHKWAWEFDIDARRENLIAFVGIIRKMAPSATQLRRALVKQCRVGNEKQGLERTENYDALCALRVLDKNSWKNFGNEATLYRHTTFCLLPTGDIPSRKAVFDMLLAGCIPVIFDSRQIDLYRWHLSMEEIAGVHVLVGAYQFSLELPLHSTKFIN